MGEQMQKGKKVNNIGHGKKKKKRKKKKTRHPRCP